MSGIVLVLVEGERSGGEGGELLDGDAVPHVEDDGGHQVLDRDRREGSRLRLGGGVQCCDERGPREPAAAEQVRQRHPEKRVERSGARGCLEVAQAGVHDLVARGLRGDERQVALHDPHEEGHVLLGALDHESIVHAHEIARRLDASRRDAHDAGAVAEVAENEASEHLLEGAVTIHEFAIISEISDDDLTHDTSRFLSQKGRIPENWKFLMIA